MKQALGIACVVLAFSSCGGSGGDSPLQTPPPGRQGGQDQTDQTAQFAGTMAGKTWVSYFYSFNFSASGGVDGTFHGYAEHFKPNSQGQVFSSAANCVGNFSGTFSYGASGSQASLQIQATSVQMISASHLGMQQETPEEVCQAYLQTLTAKSFSVQGYAADHLSASEVATIANPLDYSQAHVSSDQAVLNIDPTLFTEKDVALDQTAQSLATLAGEWDEPKPGKAKVVIDARQQTITVTDSQCGLKYSIAVSDVSYVNGNPVIRGTVTSHSDGSKACAELKQVFSSVATGGIVYGVRSATRCANFYALDPVDSFVYDFPRPGC